LQPTRAATTGGSLGDAVKDSVVRLLLQCSSVQTALAQQLLQSLQEHQDELDGGAAPAHAGMPLAKLVLSQFRWLETVVDGAALLETLEEILEVAEPPLKRELVLVLPDLVVDGQHTAAVELLARLLREDSQFTAPILESLASLHLDPALEGEVCELVTAAVASSRTTDLPAIIRFLIVYHLSAENAAGFGSGAPPARERVQHVAPRRAYKSCVSGAAGSVLGSIGTTTAAGGHPCSSCCSTARRRAVDGQGTQHAAG
jgi:hypothetical protein